MLVVTSPEPAAVVDAYALIKVMTAVDPAKEIGVLVNAARDADEAELVFRQLEVAATRFLNRRAALVRVRRARPGRSRVACCASSRSSIHHPQAPASRCFRMLASRVAGLRPLGAARAHARAPSP